MNYLYNQKKKGAKNLKLNTKKLKYITYLQHFVEFQTEAYKKICTKIVSTCLLNFQSIEICI